MRKYLKYLLLPVSFLPALPALAQGLDDAGANLGKTGLGTSGDNPVTSGTASTNLFGFIGMLIQDAFGLLGIIFVGLTLYAGYLWMTAAGDSKAVDKAKSILTQAVIGLVIMVLAYSITGYVLASISKATGA
jgi:hypothetical protein